MARQRAWHLALDVLPGLRWEEGSAEVADLYKVLGSASTPLAALAIASIAPCLLPGSCLVHRSAHARLVHTPLAGRSIC